MISTPSIDGVTFWRAGGMCPFQAEGTIDGHEFYFRYRHGRATFEADGRQVAEGYGDDLKGFLDDPEFASLFTRLVAIWRGPAQNLLGTVRRKPNGCVLAVLWPSPPSPDRWMVTDMWGSCGYETDEVVKDWPVVGAVPFSPAAGFPLNTPEAAQAQTGGASNG